MDLLDELENLAVNAAYEEPEHDAPSSNENKSTIKMWRERFGYSYEKAVELISITENNKKPISSDTTRQVLLSPAQARSIYALKLDGPFSTPEKVQIAANISHVPEGYHGTGEEGDSSFCKVDGRTKLALEIWLSEQKNITFRPLFVPEGKAYNEFSEDSLYPTLGKDATLPQNRPQDPHLLDEHPSYAPSQNEFPVWYFFYGTLASVPKLQSLLSCTEKEVPVLHQASIRGGKESHDIRKPLLRILVFFHIIEISFMLIRGKVVSRLIRFSGIWPFLYSVYYACAAKPDFFSQKSQPRLQMWHYCYGL